MRWVGLLMLAFAGLCRADAITEYCRKPDVPNPRACEDQMRGHAGRGWPNTSSPRADSKVKSSKTKPPKLAAPNVQKWLKKMPAWPQTLEDAAACAKSHLGNTLEAQIQNEN